MIIFVLTTGVFFFGPKPPLAKMTVARIAAQTAQQVVLQRLREMERQLAVSEMSEKEDELLNFCNL